MEKLLKWCLRHNEYLMLLAAVLTFYISPYLLRSVDPTAGTYDIGVLQVDILAIVAFCLFQSVVWFTMKINWLPIRCYFEDQFTTDFKSLTPWQKIILCSVFYLALLFALVLLSHVIPTVPVSVKK